MKESSGIYKSATDGSIFVVFGGKIGLSLYHDNEHKLLMMNELEESVNVGDIYDKSKVNKYCPPVSLVFNDAKSVDVVINYLERLKQYLKEKENEKV